MCSMCMRQTGNWSDGLLSRDAPGGEEPRDTGGNGKEKPNEK